MDMEKLFTETTLFFVALHSVVICLAKVINYICRNTIKIKSILLELLAWTEVCMLHYELIGATTKFIPTYYISLSVACLILLGLLWGDIESSPNVMLEYMLVNKRIRFFGILIIFIQFLGDYVAFTLLPVIWSYFGLKRSLNCSTMFHKSHETYAFVVAWLWMTVYRITIYTVANIKSVHLPREYLAIISSILLTTSRVVGYYWVGGFNNPVLGTFMRFSCSGIHDYRSLSVYWVAPFCGSLFALYILCSCKQLANYIASRPVPHISQVNLTLQDINCRVSENLWYLQKLEDAVSRPIRLPFTPHRW